MGVGVPSPHAIDWGPRGGSFRFCRVKSCEAWAPGKAPRSSSCTVRLCPRPSQAPPCTCCPRLTSETSARPLLLEVLHLCKWLGLRATEIIAEDIRDPCCSVLNVSRPSIQHICCQAVAGSEGIWDPGLRSGGGGGETPPSSTLLCARS